MAVANTTWLVFLRHTPARWVLSARVGNMITMQALFAAVEFVRLLGIGIDLEKASGRSQHLLPVPAVYLVDEQGTIRFAHWNADYKTRLSAQDLVAAARRMKGQ